MDLNDPSIAGADAESLASNIVFSLERTAVRDVYVDGKCIVRDGHHQFEEQILNNFAEIQRSIWSSHRIC